MAKQPSENMQELFDFMVDKLGGENTVKSEFIKTKIASLDASSMKFGDLLVEAKREGWDRWLHDLNLEELVVLLTPKEKKTKIPVRSGRRMTAQEKDTFHEQILEFLAENSWSFTSAIAAEMGLPTRMVGLHLKALREQGKVKTQGKKAKMKYALV
jgi:DNA-binding transcriptional ArsR family regulator